MPISWSTKLRLFALYCVVYAIFYVFPNAYGGFAEPVQLPLLEIDKIIPLVPWTFLIYLSEYLLILGVIIQLKDRQHFFSFARMSFGTVILCGICFMLYPTTYPRPSYPPVENVVVNFFMSLVGGLDTPKNCMPSMHVAVATLGAYSARHLPPRYVLFYSLWALAIMICTLTTKQHYVVDILGGIAVVGLVAFLDWRMLNPSHAPLPSNPTTH